VAAPAWLTCRRGALVGAASVQRRAKQPSVPIPPGLAGCELALHRRRPWARPTPQLAVGMACLAMA